MNHSQRNDLVVVDRDDGTEQIVVEVKTRLAGAEARAHLERYMVLAAVNVGLVVDPITTLVLKRDPLTARVRKVAKLKSSAWGLPGTWFGSEGDFERVVREALLRLRSALVQGQYGDVPPEFIPDVTEPLMRGELLSQTAPAE